MKATTIIGVGEHLGKKLYVPSNKQGKINKDDDLTNKVYLKNLMEIKMV